MAYRRISFLAWLPLVLLSTYAGVWWQAEATRWKPESAQPRDHLSGEFVRVGWSQRVAHARSVFLDPAGAYIGIAGPAGAVRILNAAGKTVSQRAIRAVDSLVLTGPGNLVAAFRRGDAADTTLTFFHLDGSVIWEHEVGEAITDVSVAQDGRSAACITQDGKIVAFTLDERPRYRHWHSTGQPRQVYVFPNGALIAVATADPPGGWVYKRDGGFAWKIPNGGDVKGTASFFPGPDGRFLVCSTVPESPQLQSRFVVMSADGRQQWGARLRAASPRVALSANGDYAAITYNKVITSGGQSIQERKVTLYETGNGTNTPHEFWQHGGPFYDPRLVAIAADGSFVATRDGGRNIHFFGTQGQLLWRYKTGAPIANTYATADGRTLLIYANDATLTLLQVLGPQPKKPLPGVKG